MAQLSHHRCPHCFAALPAEYVQRACPIGRLDDGRPCSRAEPTWRQSGAAGDSWERCPEHNVALIDVCPSPTCRKKLPSGWSEVTTTCLAMAGSSDAGKTVYVAVSANLLTRWGGQYGLSVGHYNEESRATFEDVYGVLRPKASLFQSTKPEIPGEAQPQPQQTPVLLRIKRPGLRDHVLVLRDIAGENLQDPAMDRAYFRFLANADGIILMVDPSSSQEVRRVLDGVADVSGNTYDPAAVWGNIEQLQNSVYGTQTALVPIALTISKFDLVHLAARNPSSSLSNALSALGSRMRHDPTLTSRGIDAVDAELLDLEVRSLCGYLGHPMLAQYASTYGQRAPVRFFAVSSLGHAPRVQLVAGHGMIPFRCLDPIKWFLAEAGII